MSNDLPERGPGVHNRPPTGQKYTSPQQPRAGCGAEVMVMVEATDHPAAVAFFQTISGRLEAGAIPLTRLAPGLFFGQAQATGKYWMITGRAQQ